MPSRNTADDLSRRERLDCEEKDRYPLNRKAKKERDSMSTEDTKSIAIRLADELFNKGNLGIVDELITSDAIDHNEPAGTDCRQHFKQVATLLRSAFPDLHFAFEEVIAEGDKVSARVTMSGTHQGPGAFFGVPPSGKRFEIQQMRLLRIVDGQMKESWAVIDMLGWMHQLGAMPPRPAVGGEALLRGH
jgi:predicted ester cyclase